jgi:hypothetical protein
MFHYSLYGISFSSTIAFRSPLLPATHPPRLHITEASTPHSLENTHSIMELPEEYWNLSSPQRILRSGECDIELFMDGSQIWIEPERIVYVPSPTFLRDDYRDVRLVGVGFAWWLLRQGRIPLHSGALQLNGDVVLFTAESGMGKSSLMSAFVSQGYPLVSDDFVAIRQDPATGRVVAASAYPQMRLWPNSVSQFFGDPADHPTVFEEGDKRRVRIDDGLGRFAAGEYPIHRMYLLERREESDGEILQEQLNGTDAFMTMLASMIMGARFPMSELAPIWDAVQAFTSQVPFYRLSYPSGWEHVPHLQARILEP